MMSEPPRFRRKVRCTIAQKTLLVNLLTDKYKEIAQASSCSPIALDIQHKKWMEVAAALAKIGCIKSIEQWKTSWRDLKTRARAAYEANSKALSGTANGEKVPALTDIDYKILSVIGTTRGGISKSPFDKTLPQVSSLLPDALIEGPCITISSPPSPPSPPPPPSETDSVVDIIYDPLEENIKKEVIVETEEHQITKPILRKKRRKIFVTQKPQKEARRTPKQCFNPGHKSRDDLTIFAEHIACKLRNLRDPLTICSVQNKIYNIIFQAEIDLYGGADGISNTSFSNNPVNRSGPPESPYGESDASQTSENMDD